MAHKRSDTQGLAVLIHGLWMNGMELTVLRWRLRAAGYRTTRFRYRSMSRAVDDNARRFIDFIGANQPRYIVAHSLGGLVTLRAFELQPNLPVERVVFLGAPVRGSRVAGEISRWRCGPRMLGKAGAGVLAAYHEPVWQFAPALGVLAGEQSVGLGRLVARFNGPNDGTVAVAETAIDGASDGITLNVGHMSMLASPAVADQVARFLRDGRFAPPLPAKPGRGAAP
ncbi:MAG TPA: alpha/beta fold hydrolase [Gammaproteobacteria bacterium]|nr:alpha/beta fold hydrolase [Gammaproteobacteria bacterium]